MQILTGRLLDEHAVAERLNVSVSTVRRWRLIGDGPRYVKIGTSVRYLPADVDGFIKDLPAAGGASREYENDE